MNSSYSVPLLVESCSGFAVGVVVLVLVIRADRRPLRRVGLRHSGASKQVIRRARWAVMASILASLIAFSIPSAGVYIAGFDIQVLAPLVGALAGSVVIALSKERGQRGHRSVLDSIALRPRGPFTFAPRWTIVSAAVVMAVGVFGTAIALAVASSTPGSALHFQGDTASVSYGSLWLEGSWELLAVVLGAIVVGLCATLALSRVARPTPILDELDDRADVLDRAFLSGTVIRLAGVGVMVGAGLLAQDLGGEMVGTFAVRGPGVTFSSSMASAPIGFALHAFGTLLIAGGMGAAVSTALSVIGIRAVQSPAAVAHA